MRVWQAPHSTLKTRHRQASARRPRRGWRGRGRCREREPGWEALARARSGDALWDLAQRSLLVHGELRNNVRMTWGKAIVQWTDGPAQALDWLLDLNHRYALDGSDGRRVVPVPAMKSLVAHLLADIDDCRFATEVRALERCDERWVLHTADGVLASGFDAVLVTAPAPQAAALLQPVAPALARATEDAQIAPCWTLTIADPALDAGKPGRDAAAGTWVVQASVDWSTRRLELDRDTAGEQLWAEAAPLFGAAADAPPPGLLLAHRWRYARVTRPLGREALWDDARAIGAGGDWCLGPRVECALLSGAALAGHVLSHAAPAAARVDR